jgi:hypothetical protein
MDDILKEVKVVVKNWKIEAEIALMTSAFKF